MLSNEQLTQKIEFISVQFILVEPDDTDGLRRLVSLFDDILKWAKENGQSILESSVEQFITCANDHFSSDTSSREDFLSLMGTFLSDLQIHARNDYDFSQMNIIKRIDTFQEHYAVIPTNKSATTAASIEVKDCPAQSLIRHPDTLPGHLDMELFAEFLELQSSVIDQMEDRLLTLERNPGSGTLQELKRIIHTQKGEAGFLNLTDIEKLCHVTEDLLESENAKGFADHLFSVIDWLRKTNSWYKGESQEKPDSVLPLVESLQTLAQSQTISLQQDKEPVSEKITIPSDKTGLSSEKRTKQTIRVDAERLDKLIDMIGELMIVESMVVQSKEIRSVQSQELLKNIGQMDKITRTLHEAGLMLRMVPIKETFQKMARLVRETAKKSGKTVQCNIQGEDTELDKTLVDKIGEPLLHIIRNAVDHGIEDSEQTRIACGKPPHGTIEIRAFHKSGYVHIEIEDDGSGLNKASIIQKAKENRLISDESQINNDDVFNLIFEPGFSTAERITDLSGRGQGMGVVKDVVDSLHGQIDCRSTEGKGCMFTLKIPLTLAIIDGMIVRAGKDRFIIPTLSIITSCRLETKNITELISREKTILVQGRLIPLIDLCSWFEIEKNKSGKGPELMVVVENASRRIALAVDEIIGKQQIVIKNLGAGFKHSAGISGAAIMPDGTVGLIVDIDRLTHL